MEPLKLSETTGYLVRRAQQTHVAVWLREVSSEVTSVQFGVLNVLRRSPGASQRDLCDELDLDRSTIADLVVRLEGRGLIERVRATADRRRNVLRLTRQGEHEFDLLVPRAADVEKALTGHLSAQQRDDLRQLLTAVLDSPADGPGAKD